MAKLEDLLEDSDLKEGKDKIANALRIAAREWENIKLSLSLCGDIGQFSKDDYMIGTISEDIIIRYPKKSPTKSVSGYSPTYYPMYFIDNLIKMDEKLEDKEYKTTEALYTYVELVTKAAERLGLEGNLASGFGCGYAFVRTSWIAEKGLEEERLKFAEIFFSKRSRKFDWDFHWDSVQDDLKNVYEQFVSWKNNPEAYIKDSTPKAVVRPFIV